MDFYEVGWRMRPACGTLSLMGTAVSFKVGSGVFVGTVVRLVNGRLRGHAVVTKTRYVQRGRNAGKFEYTLAPVDADQWGEKIYCARVFGERFFAEPTETFDAELPKNRINGVFAVRVQISETKMERADEGREAIDTNFLLSVGRGDQVLVRFKNGPTVEIFEGVNWKTGKVAIRQSWNKRGVRWVPAKFVERMRAEAKA